MLTRDMSRNEIERVLSNKGDFVKIDYLKRYLSKDPPVDMKKFALLKLAELYEKKFMFFDAARNYESIAILSVTFSDKIKYYLNETQMFIKAGDFQQADNSMKKALGEANASQRAEIFFTIKQIYKTEAEKYEKELKRNQASKIYEKMLKLNLSETEKKEIKKKLLNLYEKLGRFSESAKLQGLKDLK